MRSSKPKRILWLVLLALIGAGYLGAFSELDLLPMLRTQLVLLPVQVGALIYFLWWKRREQPESKS